MAAVAAALARLALTLQIRLPETAAQAQPRQFLARLRHMLAGAAVAPQITTIQIQKAQAARVVAVMAANLKPRPGRDLLVQQTLVVVAVVVGNRLQMELLAAPAAPASSSSNTTSALPQSSPSSHRRSGLHLLARSALTTSW
jgi:hypothetical protein